MSSLSFYISVWFIRRLNTTELTDLPRCRYVLITSRTSSTVHTEPPHFYSKTDYVNQCIVFILFWSDTLYVSDGLSVQHQKFNTVHKATSICQTDTAVWLQTALSVWHILEWHTTCFGRSFRPASEVQDCTYSNKHMSNRYCCLLADSSICLTYFGMTLYMFRTVFPSIIRSSRLYICLLLYVQSWTSDDGRKVRPKDVECHSKINLIHWCI